MLGGVREESCERMWLHKVLDFKIHELKVI